MIEGWALAPLRKVAANLEPPQRGAINGWKFITLACRSFELFFKDITSS